MNMIVVKPISEKNANAAFKKMYDKCYRQGPQYSHYAAMQTGSSSEFAGAYLDGELIGFWNVRIKKAIMNITGIAYINHGPLICISDTYSKEKLTKVLNAIVDYYVKERNLSLRITPHIQGGLLVEEIKQSFINAGFVQENEVYRSVILDLDEDITIIRKNLHAKWRGHLNKSEKFDQTILKSNSAEKFDELQLKLQSLADKKNFTVRQDAQFFKKVSLNASEAEEYQIFYSVYEGQIVSMALGSFFGDTATYLLGASSLEARPIRSAYAVQWAMIQYAISKGMKYYDMGGVDKDTNPNVFEFKERTNGRMIECPAKFVVYASTIQKTLLPIAENLYQRMRR